jgi:predicted nucleic acid-binding protein
VICVSDTNILSSFLGVGRLDLLLAALDTDHVVVPPRVLDELETGVLRGYLPDDALQNALAYGAIRTMAVEAIDQQRIQLMPAAFGYGEQQAVALALRLSVPLLSNDRRVVTYCRAQGVLCLDLPTLLRLIWRSGTASQDEVQALMQGMAHHEGIVFRHAERIFAEEGS